ncbi:MAG TPA: hypothetical protein VJM33_13190 [Microthrixaceae bacterium]|nr:hypothetical protein [Microthrixaceae bacterium]
MPETLVPDQVAAGSTLEVEFLDERWRLERGGSLTFGRAADLVIDENPFMHRVVGRFVHRNDVWWLQNHSRRIALDIEDDVATRASVAPAGQFSITSARTTVRFSCGPGTYELVCELVGRAEVASHDVVPAATSTIDFGVVPLTVNQHLLLVALSASRLAGVDTIPSSHVAAASLGWSITKLNRQLDHLCQKLHRAGVRGLCGDQATRALDRRRTLVDHAISSGLVTSGDLGLLWRS